MIKRSENLSGGLLAKFNTKRMKILFTLLGVVSMASAYFVFSIRVLPGLEESWERTRKIERDKRQALESKRQEQAYKEYERTHPPAQVVLPPKPHIYKTSFDCIKTEKLIEDRSAKRKNVEVGTLIESRICREEYLATQELELSKKYLGLMNSELPSVEKEKLRNSQRQWIKDRESCWKNESMDADGCIHGKTSERISEFTLLERIYITKDLTLESLGNGVRRYHDLKYGFEVQIPAEVEIFQGATSSYLMPANWSSDSDIPGDSATTFRILPKVLGEYHTSAEVRVGVNPGTTLEKACEIEIASQKGATLLPSKTIHSVMFHVHEFESGGMSHYANGTAYRTFQRGYCFGIEFKIDGASLGAFEDENGSLERKDKQMKANLQDVKKIANKIIETFRLDKTKAP
jgi:uncharacterized protein YecT (DUF1311 family)